jgi:cytoskeletal protein CcmA (bactofilin family)
MCKRCSGFVDLKDYRIDHSVTKNFKTKGRFVVEEKAFVFNTDSIVGDAIIKGRYHGKLLAEHSLEIHSSADIRGSFKTGCLIIPSGNHFRWSEPLVVTSADIAGELVADLRVEETISLRATGRLFGEIRAGNLVVESGAILEGIVRVRPKT